MNDRKKVVGLVQNSLTEVPKVMLKGTGPAADFIEKEFKKNNKSHKVVKNKELVDNLFRLPIDSEINPSLYQLVALLLVHVYRAETKLKGDLND